MIPFNVDKLIEIEIIFISGPEDITSMVSIYQNGIPYKMFYVQSRFVQCSHPNVQYSIQRDKACDQY